MTKPFDIPNIDRLMQSKAFEANRAKQPKHIAISMGDNEPQKKSSGQAILHTSSFYRRDQVLDGLIKAQARLNIPILTIMLADPSPLCESYIGFFASLKSNPSIHINQVKISVLGKWYDTAGRLVEEVKHAIDETKDYDKYFLNLCLNYEGQEEIVDSCRLIARKIRAGKIEIESINKDLIKENLYSSYFLPPDIIIMTGTKRTWSSLLLWDSAGAFYCFPNRPFAELSEADLLKAIADYSNQ
jgi:undecaprenyl pyrophosphate synthase